ncbi:hypothetical protein LTS18_001635, partial [Coniosporium uncinatum]
HKHKGCQYYQRKWQVNWCGTTSSRHPHRCTRYKKKIEKLCFDQTGEGELTAERDVQGDVAEDFPVVHMLPDVKAGELEPEERDELEALELESLELEA